jgi:hypothetical protein
MRQLTKMKPTITAGHQGSSQPSFGASANAYYARHHNRARGCDSVGRYPTCTGLDKMTAATYRSYRSCHNSSIALNNHQPWLHSPCGSLQGTPDNRCQSRRS